MKTQKQLLQELLQEANKRQQKKNEQDYIQRVKNHLRKKFFLTQDVYVTDVDFSQSVWHSTCDIVRKLDLKENTSRLAAYNRQNN